MELRKQVITTWRIHNRVNLLLLENISDDGLKATLSKRGGRDVARQLAHICMVRVWRLSSFAKKLGEELIEFEKGESPPREKLKVSLIQTGRIMELYLEHALKQGGEVSNFKLGVIPMLGYYISHESHHRGSILLTLKQSGFKLPDELKWGIWDWKKLVDQ